MRRVLAAALALASVLAVGVAASAPRQAPVVLGVGAPDAVTGQYVVVLRGDSPVAAQARALADRYGGVLGSVYEQTLHGFAVTMTEERIRRLAADPAVEYVQQSQISHAQGTQEDPGWGLDRIDQRGLPFDFTFSAEEDSVGVTIFVVDSGIYKEHKDFAGGRARDGVDVYDHDDVADDCNGHGTEVAGLAAGTLHGVAKSARVVGVRVFDCAGVSGPTSVLDGLEWVSHRPERPAVVTLSIGNACTNGAGEPTRCPSTSPLRTAMERLVDLGFTVVVAAGNRNVDACSNPFAISDKTIRVAASNPADGRWTGPVEGSNFGGCVDLFAPGVDLPTAFTSSPTASVVVRGTSFAAPLVVGAVALMLARPGWGSKTPAELKAQLLAEATPGVLTGIGTSPNRLLYTPPPPAGVRSTVALARNLNGTPTLFAVNAGGTLYSQTSPPQWSRSLYPGLYSLCADTATGGRIDLVGIQRTGRLWRRQQNVPNVDSWTGWRPFDGLLVTCAEARTAGGALELFGTNTQGTLFRRGAQWESFGFGAVHRAVAAERNANDVVELFVVLATGDMWHRWETGPGQYTTWTQLSTPPGVSLATAAVARGAGGRLTLFGVTREGDIWSVEALAGVDQWGPWQAMARPPAGTVRSIAVESDVDGRFVLAAMTGVSVLYTSHQLAGGGYSPWVNGNLPT